MTCPICNNLRHAVADENVRDFEYGAPGRYTYHRCLGCGLLTIDPLPDAQILARAYPDDYHAYRSPDSVAGRWMKRAYWRRKAQTYTRLVGPDAAVLDIGCAHGDFLAEMQALGCRDLWGLDFSPGAARRAQSRGFNVLEGDIDTADLPEGRFDLIAATNFIEHVANPVEVLRRCARLLLPGGFLVGETPNATSWDYFLFRRFWGGYHAPRHLCLFNRHNLPMLAARAGLLVRGVNNLIQPAHWALSIQNRLSCPPTRLRVTAGRSGLYIHLLLLAMPANMIQFLFSQSTALEFVFQKAKR